MWRRTWYVRTCYGIANSRLTVLLDPRTDEWKPAFDAAHKSDLIIYVGGVDNEQEAEGRDRMKIGWAAAQIDLIQHLASLGKPVVIMQMGGGSLDAQWIKDDDRIGGLIWGGKLIEGDV
jgi:beta-D-xylosidase 4